MGWLFKSNEEKWAEAKQSGHERRAANGQKVSKTRGSYTTAEKVKDQKRVAGAKNKRLK